MPVKHAPTPQPSPSIARDAVAYVIDVADLTYAYPGGQEALRGVSLRVAPGEKVALVGPNGAGKSTLMLHLNGILGGPTAPVRICGRPLTRENLPLIRGLVGLVFQNPDDQLFSPTVFEDVAFGPLYQGLPEAEVRRRAGVALAQVGMAGFEGRLSHQLSLGQKKRVAIATVLSMQPECWCSTSRRPGWTRAAAANSSIFCAPCR